LLAPHEKEKSLMELGKEVRISLNCSAILRILLNLALIVFYTGLGILKRPLGL